MEMRKVARKDELPPNAFTNASISARCRKFESVDMGQFFEPYKAFFEWLNAVGGEEVNTEEFMARVYSLVDLIAAELGKHSICRKGCGYCCAIPVDLSMIEASYIAMTYGKEILPTPRKPSEIDKNSFCPFLDTKTFTCGIRDARPLNCRTFFALDDWRKCIDPKTKHLIFSTGGNKMLFNIMELLIQVSEIDDYPITSGDIRRFFD